MLNNILCSIFFQIMLCIVYGLFLVNFTAQVS